MLFLINCNQTFHYFEKFCFPNLNPTSYLDDVILSTKVLSNVAYT